MLLLIIVILLHFYVNNGLRGENDFLKNFNIFCQNNCVVYSNLRLGKPKPIQKNHSLTIIGSSRKKESLAENLYRHNQKKNLDSVSDIGSDSGKKATTNIFRYDFGWKF